jgi:hypothetical protein
MMKNSICMVLCRSKVYPSGRAVYASVCGRSLGADCGFESRRAHGCLSLVNVVCFARRGLCVGLITRPEEYYRVVRLSVTVKPR